MTKTLTLAEAISKFGAEATSKLNNPGAKGEPEDQLRNPLEQLIKVDLAALIGPAARDLELVGETSLADLQTRPDFSVTRDGALIGFIEVKRPGKGADPEQYKDHDKEQWRKLKALPNLIYTDGNAFSLWQDGKKAAEIVHLGGDVRTSGKALTAPLELVDLFLLFCQWDPVAPRTPKQLAETTARLCRLLRDQVLEQLALGSERLKGLKADWQNLLAPEAEDDEFADGYAQAVSFGLLMARARGIPLKDGIGKAATALRQKNTLIGSALRLLTEDADDDRVLDTSLKTLTAVLGVVDWPTISKDDPEAWLYFYELFLQQYDPKLRRKTGSYYTPPEVMTAMVAMVDEALQSPERFALDRGLASPEVTLADPAVGTGTFLLGVLRRIARTVEDRDGAGSVGDEISSALDRLVGFEIQFGPFAVAQLRLLAEVADLTASDPTGLEEPPTASSEAADPGKALRVYVADTLSDPDREDRWVASPVEGVAASQREANRIKREAAITVVLGNPPYKVKAKGLGGWVEDRGPGQATPLDDWQPPTEWGLSAHAKHLRNLYVYFWRWATWKVFGGDRFHSGKGEVVPT